MRGQRGQDNEMERILEQENRQPGNIGNPNNDRERVSVRFNGVEQPIVERQRRVEWEEDPQNPGVMTPYIVSDTVYSVDQNGHPLVSTRRAGGCRFGHIATTSTLSTCARCRQTICQRHSMTVGNRRYCRAGLCFLVGAVAWSFWLVFSIVAFCVMNILGIRGNNERDNPEEAPPQGPQNPVRRDVNRVYPNREE